MEHGGRTLFLMKLLGFSLFWTWLFLVAVSPSPLFGQLTGMGDTPFEMSEVGFRVILLAVTLVFSRQLATLAGRHALVIVCATMGVVSIVSLSLAQTPTAVTISAAFVALVEVSMFLLWVCFLGFSKLGETALLLALSYAAGSLLCLIAVPLGKGVMTVLALGIPLVSGFAFTVSMRYASARFGESLFDQPAQEVVSSSPPPSIKRMTAALLLYAFAFAFYSSRTASSEFQFASGPLVQATCSLVLAAIVGLSIKMKDESRGLYTVYRSIPLLYGTGFALFALAPSWLSPAVGICIMLAYLLFEVLSLNDYCNIVKTNDYSLLRSMAIVRASASVGIFIGWCFGFALARILGDGASPLLVSTVGFMIVLVASTLVFTDKSMRELDSVAGHRALQEATENQPSKATFVPAFAEVYGLSGRETDVLGYLIAGRTTQYIADKLFIAESTVRTHVHKIYLKTDSQTRMHLLDSFEQFCEDRTIAS